MKVIQARLGHASAKTSLDTYGHLFPDEDAAPEPPSTSPSGFLRTICGRARQPEPKTAGPAPLYGSDVVVEVELPRVGTQANLVDLALALVLDPGLDQIGGEDAAGLEVLLVGLEGGQGLVK